MKWIFVKILLLLLLSATLNASHIELNSEQRDYLLKNPTISVSNELDWYPYDFNQNGDANGYAVDYLKLLADKIGLRISFISAPWNELYKKFEKKEIDILYPAAKTDDREKIAIFSKEMIKMRFSLITKFNRDDINSFDDMRGKTLALVKGWSSTKYIIKNYKDIYYKEYDTSKEVLEAVAFGLADGGVEDFFTANYLIKKEMLSNLHVASKVLLLKIKSKWLGALQKGKRKIFFENNEKKYLMSKKVINICVDPNWMPLEKIEDGVHIGISSDYIKEFEKRLDVPIKLIETATWTESLKFAKERKCDILSLAMATPKRKKYLNFTTPYLDIPLVLITKYDKMFFADISYLQNRPIGITKDYAYGEILSVKYPHLDFVDVDNVYDGLKKVEKGELFGYIDSLATAGYMIQNDYFGTLKIAAKLDERWELGIAVRNDDKILFSIFEKLIESIDEETSRKILNKWISVKYDTKTDYTYFVVFLFISAVFIFYRQYQLKKHNNELEILSITDKLTGIYNRMKLDEVMEYEKNLFDRFHRKLSIIMFDIDDFKKVNDKFGHKIGDEVLQDIAKIVLKNKRKTDILGRWGGEEFLIICHETDLKGAIELAEKFREAICSYSFKKVKRLSASFGVAEFKVHESIEKVFVRADDGLYKAKKSGKNRVSFTEK